MEDGRFKNGIPIDDVPPEYRTCFHIRDNLNDILNDPPIYRVASWRFRLGKGWKDHSYGYAFDGRGPVEQAIRAAILSGERHIRSVFIVRWLVDREDGLRTCVFLCVDHDQNTYWFGLKFLPDGGTKVVFWSQRREGFA